MRIFIIVLLFLSSNQIIWSQEQNESDPHLLHKNLEFGYEIFVKDSLFKLFFFDELVFVSDGSFEFEIGNHPKKECVCIFQVLDNSKTTLRVKEEGCSDTISRSTPSTISLTVVNDSLLFINDNYDKMFVQNDVIVNDPKVVQSGNQKSSFFSKDGNGLWVRKTEYYSSITSVNREYIATIEGENTIPLVDSILVKGSYYMISNHFQSETRYLYLQHDLKAKSFIDYYDFKRITDLGFGLQFETDRGAFFVTYEGNAITDDQWDGFVLEDNRIKAFNKSGEKYFDL